MRLLRIALAQLAALSVIGVADAHPGRADGFVQRALQSHLDALLGQLTPQPLAALAPDGTIANQPSPGLVDTVAGQPTVWGFAGDGGPSVDALLDSPDGVAFDDDGNIYIADRRNLRVRRVDAVTGVITTIAGGGVPSPWVSTGPATTAYLTQPRNVRVLADGDLYIADSTKIRKVDLDTGTISTVAGAGEAFCCSGFRGEGVPAIDAWFAAPNDMVLGPNGDLYIADTGNQIIRRVDATTGIITTFAGTQGVYSSTGDGGPASSATFAGPNSLDIDGHWLYVAETGAGRIRRIDLTTGIITTFAGAPPAAGGAIDGAPATAGILSRPQAISVDVDGDLYISEEGASRIRRVDVATGLITTVAGGAGYGDCGDGGPSIQACMRRTYSVAVAPNGMLAFSDDNRVRFVTPGGPPEPVGSPALEFVRGNCCSSDRLVVRWSLPGTPVNRIIATTSPRGARASVPGAATEASIAGLTDGDRYTVSIVATNGWGWSAPVQTPAATFGNVPPVPFDRLDPAAELDPAITQADFVNAYLLTVGMKAVYGDPTRDAADQESIIESSFTTLGLRDVVFVDEPSTDSQFAVGRRGDTIVVTFRGSESGADWLSNSQVGQFAFDTSAGPVWAHSGFSLALLSILDRLQDELDVQRLAAPNAEIVLAGHSLGGALAELAAVRLHDAGYPIASVHTIGTPAIGGQPLTDAYDALGLAAITHRWVNDRDVVPMALDLITGYTEVGRTHTFVRGVDEPILDAPSEPYGQFGFFDHDIAIYAENLLRQITDTTLLPPPPARLTDPLSSFDTEMVLEAIVVWAIDTAQATNADIAAFLAESQATADEALAALIAALPDLDDLARVVTIMEDAYDLGAPAVAELLADIVPLADLEALARALLAEYELAQSELIAVLVAAGYDAATVAAVVAALFDQIATDIASGLAGLPAQLAAWAAAFGFDGDAGLLPADLAAVFGLDELFADLTFPTLDPAATAAEVAVAMEAAGWTVDWVAGGAGALQPPTDDDVIQLRRTLTLDVASLTDPIGPTANGLLDGLADALALSATGTLEGTITIDLVIGADIDGFYIDPATTITLDVDASVEVVGDASIGGVAATLTGTVTPNVTATVSPERAERIRPLESVLFDASLAGSVGTTLTADLGDVELTWTGAWSLDAITGSTGTNATHELLPGATLAGIAALPFVDPPAVVALGGTYLGAGGWQIDGTLTGTFTAAALTVTGLDVDATITPTTFAGTVVISAELLAGAGDPIAAELVVAWSPTGTQIAGSIRLDDVDTGSVAFDGITLEVATTGDGVEIDVVSDPDGTITLFPDFDLVTLAQPVGSLTADGVLSLSAATASASIAGGIVVELTDPTIVLDPGAPTPSPVVTIPTAVATIPALGGLTVTLTGLELMNDGTVRVTSATADPQAVTDVFPVAGLLPFEINFVSVTFPDPSLPFDRFDATVTGRFDFQAFDALPFTPILTIGDRAVDGDAEGADAEFTFTVRAQSLATGDIRPLDLGPITIGFADLAAGPITIGATITLGGYADGVLVAPDGLSTGRVVGAASVIATGDGLSGSLDAVVDGSLDIGPERTVLDIDTTLVVSGQVDDVFTVEDLSLGIGLTVEAGLAGISVTALEVDDVTVAELGVTLGDLVRVTLRDTTLAGASAGAGASFSLVPAPGTDWITIGGTPAGPGAQIELLDDDLGDWGGGVGNLALRVVDDGSGGTAVVPVVLAGFYADVDFPEDTSFGFPDWLPLTFRDAGITFPAIAPDDLASGTGIELTPELLAGMRIRVSASLDGDGETFPISGAVEGLEVDIGLLAAGQFPITNLDAAMFGIEPFDLGPMTVGGGLGLGLIGVDANGDGIDDGQVFFGRIFGEFSYSGFGAGVEIVLTQYGPVLAKINAPAPIVLGTSGLMLAGVRGGIQFGGEGLVPPGDPRDLIGDPRYDLDVPISLDVIRTAVESCVAKNAGRSGTPDGTWPCFTWNDGGLVTIGTTITSYAAPGVVSADVDGAIDLRFVRDEKGQLVLGPNGLPVPPAVRFAATGTVDIWGIGLADAVVLVAFDDPLAPTLDMAVQMPGISGPIGFLVPATGDFTVHLGTDGIAAGAIEATRILLTSIVDGATSGSEVLFADALDTLAASLERARTLTDATGRPLGRVEAERVAVYRLLVQALLDVDGDGVVDPEEQRTIDRQFLLDRMLGGSGMAPLLPPIDATNVSELATIAEPLAELLRSFQFALLTEAQRLVTATPASFPFTVNPDPADLAALGRAGAAFAEVMAAAALTGITQGAAAWGAVFDPVLRVEGGIQPVIAGVPFGEPNDSATFTIGRDRLGFGLTTGIESLFMAPWGAIGLAASELNKVFGVNTIVDVEGTLALPDVFGAVAAGDPMVLDPFDADWNVQLAMTTKVAGFTLQESRGILIPPELDDAALRQLVCRIDRPDIAPCGGDRIPVNGDDHWSAVSEFGGLLLSYELLAPRVATDPAGVAAELRLEPPDEWLGWLDVIRNNFTAATSLATVGSHQIFIPSIQRYLDPSYAAEQLWPVASTDLDRLGFATTEAALEAAEEIRGAFYAEGFWDVDLFGLPLASGVISVDDDDQFRLDARFPMFGDQPITVRFGGTTVTDGRRTAALPVPGFDVTLTGGDANAALAGFGLPAAIALDPTASLRVQAYGPGYEPASTVPIRRDGGIQIDAVLDLTGLADDAEFTLSVVGASPATAELRGIATVDTLGTFGGVTITDATIEITRIGGVWSVGITGDASTPFGSGMVEATLDSTLAGTMTVTLGSGAVDLDGFEVQVAVTVASTRTDRGALEFTSSFIGTLDLPALGWNDVVVQGAFTDTGVERLELVVGNAQFGPVSLSHGTFELVRDRGQWRLSVVASAVAPGVVDALSVSGMLAPDGTGTLTVTSTAAIRVGSSSATAVALTNPAASIVRTLATTRLNLAGDVTLLDQAVRLSGQLTIATGATTGSLTAATGAAGFPFGTATIAGTFTLTITASPPPSLQTSIAVTFAGAANIPGLGNGLAVSGTIASTGTTSLTLATTSITLDGFTLTNGTFTLRRAAGGTATTLTVGARLGLLGVTADIVDGTLTISPTNPSGSLTLTSATPFTLGAFSLSGGFRLDVGGGGAAVDVTSSLTVPGIVDSATVTGTLDWSNGTSGSLVGGLSVASPSVMPLGGAGSALRLSGTLSLIRAIEQTGSGPVVVTTLTVTGATIAWSGVDTFTFPDLSIGSNGSISASANADSFTVGTFTVDLPAISVFVGPAGAGAELRMGPAGISITGIGTLAVDAFAVGTTGDFQATFTTPSFAIGGYTVAGGALRFERQSGVLRIRLTSAGTLGAAGLPAPITLDSFTLATNGTVAASITARRFGPSALNVRDATIAFSRTATTGPTLSVTGGKLHLPVGEPVNLPTLTFATDGTVTTSFNRALTLGPGVNVPSTPTTPLQLRFVATGGVLAIEQTAPRTFTLLGSTVTFDDFRAASDGAFTGSVDGNISPLGFQLAGASFTISKPSGWVDARLDLDDPITVNFGIASAAVDGWVATNGRFRFDTSVSISLTNQQNLVDAKFFDIGGTAALVLRNTGMSGTFTGTISIPLLCAATFSGTVNTSGELTGTFVCNPQGPNNEFVQTVRVKLFSPLPVGNDTVRPSLAPIDDITTYGANPTPVYFDVDASDDRDNAPVATCRNQSNATVASGSSFPTGTSTVTCTATDAAGNVSLPRTFTITVITLSTLVYSIESGSSTSTRPDDPPDLATGDQVTVRTSGFEQRTDVLGTFHSTPVAVGTARSDASGAIAFTFVVPAVPPGRHHLELTGVAPGGSTLQVVLPIDVVGQAPPPTTAPSTGTTTPRPPTATPPTGDLPRTGSDPSATLLIAVLVLAAGSALVIASRRRWSR